MSCFEAHEPTARAHSFKTSIVHSSAAPNLRSGPAPLPICCCLGASGWRLRRRRSRPAVPSRLYTAPHTYALSRGLLLLRVRSRGAAIRIQNPGSSETAGKIQVARTIGHRHNRSPDTPESPRRRSRRDRRPYRILPHTHERLLRRTVERGARRESNPVVLGSIWTRHAGTLIARVVKRSTQDQCSDA